MSKSKKQVKPEMEVKEEDNNNEIIETVEEVQENKPKKKIVTEAMKEHLATIRIKALKVKLEKKSIKGESETIRKCRIRIKS